MRSLGRWFALWLWLGLFASATHAQSIDTTPKDQSDSPPPDTGVLDESRVLARDSDAYKNIVTHLRELREKRNYPIYLVIEPVLIGSTAPELASRCRLKWLPGSDGLVIVFEADSRNMGISLDLSSPPEHPDQLNSVPTYETSGVITRATKGIDPVHLAPEVYLETLIGRLTHEYEAYFESREEPAPKGRGLRIGMLVLGTIALFGLVAIGLGSLIRHSGMAVTRRFLFAAVDLPERLGAPCGGSVTSRRFQQPP